MHAPSIRGIGVSAKSASRMRGSGHCHRTTSLATAKTESTYTSEKAMTEHYALPKKRLQIMKMARFSAVMGTCTHYSLFHPQSTAVIHPLRKNQFYPSAVNRSHENSGSRPGFLPPQSTAVMLRKPRKSRSQPQSTAVNAPSCKILASRVKMVTATLSQLMARSHERNKSGEPTEPFCGNVCVSNMLMSLPVAQPFTKPFYCIYRATIDENISHKHKHEHAKGPTTNAQSLLQQDNSVQLAPRLFPAAKAAERHCGIIPSLYTKRSL